MTYPTLTLEDVLNATVTVEAPPPKDESWRWERIEQINERRSAISARRREIRLELRAPAVCTCTPRDLSDNEGYCSCDAAWRDYDMRDIEEDLDRDDGELLDELVRHYDALDI